MTLSQAHLERLQRLEIMARKLRAAGLAQSAARVEAQIRQLEERPEVKDDAASRHQ